MYGLSRDANFSFLIGKEICQIAIGPYDVQFNWGKGVLSVWGKFIYKMADSREVIVWEGKEPYLAARTVRLLQTKIISQSPSEDGTLRLLFSNGDQLDVLDPDPRYEAYSINDGKRQIVV